VVTKISERVQNERKEEEKSGREKEREDRE
jgi:hypothetical protein